MRAQTAGLAPTPAPWAPDRTPLPQAMIAIHLPEANAAVQLRLVTMLMRLRPEHTVNIQSRARSRGAESRL
jgi:hypothetical protein